MAVGAFVAAGGGLAAGVSIPGTETERVTDRLVEELPDAGGASGPVVFTRDDGGALDEQQRAADVDVEGAGLQRHDVPVPGPGRALEPAGI